MAFRIDSQSNEQPRFEPCNGSLLRQLRQSRSWTQRDLATQSGYSLRLIQKAEAGGSLHPETLQVLAKTLSTPSEQVSVDHLMATPLALVKQFIEAVNIHHEKTIAEVPHLFDENMVVWCAGEEDHVPFAGTWEGIEQVEAFFNTFFTVLTVTNPPVLHNMRFASSSKEVVAWGESRAGVEGMPSPTVWVWHRYVVRDCKIIRLDNHFDTAVGTRHLAEARALGLLKNTN